MYKYSKEVFDKLIHGDVKINSITRNMYTCSKRKDIEQYTIFAKAKGTYKVWEDNEGTD